MSKAGLFLALFVISAVARADEPPVTKLNQAELEEKMCAETKCQHNLRVVLKQKDGTTYDRTFAVFPSTVQGFGITVVAGQTIYVEANLDGNGLVKYRPVEQITNPEITITAKFEQMEDGGMMLSLNNPFDRPLKFDMGIMPLDSDDLYKTSSCPVIARGSSFEMWPYPIFQVVLGDGRLMNPDDSTACVE